MTSLDILLSTLEPKCSFILALQNTPQNILLVVSTENFWQSINTLNRHDIRLRFLEERELSLDIHLSFSIKEVFYEVTFRIVDSNSHLFSELEKIFPHAAVFIQEIKRKN